MAASSRVLAMPTTEVSTRESTGPHIQMAIVGRVNRTSCAKMSRDDISGSSVSLSTGSSLPSASASASASASPEALTSSTPATLFGVVVRTGPRGRRRRTRRCLTGFPRRTHAVSGAAPGPARFVAPAELAVAGQLAAVAAAGPWEQRGRRRGHNDAAAYEGEQTEGATTAAATADLAADLRPPDDAEVVTTIAPLPPRLAPTRPIVRGCARKSEQCG
mmetsp:Transcript_18320/g.45640  ORF Transcript_18320/g.45640 Transcript_18320/m.45640 type:complete len:218 (-) Transcript_18320:104-757(-)